MLSRGNHFVRSNIDKSKKKHFKTLTPADNKWHWVVIGRPSRYRHTLMVDGHLATATTRGDNYHLDLDGILHLGNSFSYYFEFLNFLFLPNCSS
jgi:hypothetical protein